MQEQEIIISRHLEENLARAIGNCPHDKLFVLTDRITQEKCWPLVAEFPCMAGATHIVIDPTDEHKNLETLSAVWTMLGHGGGFAAATFKRGIRYINIPTTLLSMVDAAVGGKTGINFNGLKNEIGAFCPAASVLINTEFLRTLDHENICSGYAEMLKHGLISTESHWAELVTFNLENIDYARLQDMVGQSVAVKENIVAQDPREQGIRKALNLGHTAGHAIELYLSCVREGFPKDKMRQTVNFIKENYGTFAFDCKAYETLYQFMTHDKKNTAGHVNFTLLCDVGDILIDQTAGKEEIFNMLDFYRETMGC